MATKNLSDYDITSVPDASNMIFGVVVAEWNPEITGALLLSSSLEVSSVARPRISIISARALQKVLPA